MAARLNLKHQADVRTKIQSSQLINVLQEHVFNGRELTKSQVSAAVALLRKTVPDLSQVQGTIASVNLQASELSDAELASVISGYAAVSSDRAIEAQAIEDESDRVH